MVALRNHRIEVLDVLRGLVMVLMALDHTRDFFHSEAFTRDPLDVQTTTGILFFTRWITHFCAPVFVFLAGISIYLQGLRKGRSELSTFLLKRGLWLIVIEIFVIGFAWTFDIQFHAIIFQVIWAIGISMLLMSLIVYLPYNAILILGLTIVAGHNLLDVFNLCTGGFACDLLHNGDFATHEIMSNHKLVIIYPFVPWLGLMMTGYSFGYFYRPEIQAPLRRKRLLQISLGLLVTFILLRAFNVYGDPQLWSVQDRFGKSLMSFINVDKYPPSLLFVCMTIAPALLFLRYFENKMGSVERIFSVYGRVPFFYYILHFYVLHILCMVLFASRGHDLTGPLNDIFGIPFRYVIAGEGYSLGVVYIIWIGLVLMLYPLCKWYDRLKSSRKYAWMSYL